LHLDRSHDKEARKLITNEVRIGKCNPAIS